MKKLSFILVVNLMAAMTPAVWAQAKASSVQPISLLDCVQAALEHNLDLQIERYNPRFRQLEIEGNYGPWDPRFTISGRHDYSRSGGGFSEITGTNTPPIINDQDSFSSSLGGVLPWGLNYSLYGNVGERQFNFFPFDQSGGKVGVDLTQPLLKNFWIDETRLRIAVSKIALRQSELGLRLRMMEIVTAVEKAYYDLIPSA